MKKKIHYVAGQSSYEIELRPGFNKWWLLLLLLPLLLLIRLEKTVYVKAVYDNQVAVPGVSVAFQYKRYIPFSDGALLSDSLIVLKGITDSSGVVKLEGLRYSVFSYIFKWGTDAMVYGESDCYASDTLLTRFHGLSDGGELVLPMNPSRVTLDFRVVDKEDGEPLPDSRVLLRSSLLGKVYIDSARSDTAGMVRFSGVPKCGKVELAHGSQEGYYSDSIVDREVPVLLAGGLDSNRTLRLKPIRVPITFFITDCQTGKGLSGATGEISFTYPNGKPGKKKRVLTNIHGVGKGTYDSAWLLSTIEIIGSRPGYKDGRLDGVHPVRDFIQYPKEKRTFCLEPLPPPPPPPTPPPPTPPLPDTTPPVAKIDCPDRVLVFQVCNSNNKKDDNFDFYLNGHLLGKLDLSSDLPVGSVFIASLDRNKKITSPDFVCSIDNMKVFYFNPAYVNAGTNRIEMINTQSNNNYNKGTIGIRNYLISGNNLISPCMVGDIVFDDQVTLTGRNFSFEFQYNRCCE
jgi:hypothetical protein